MAEFPALAPQVDNDGNDIDGVRSLSLMAPLGTYTGWNTRAAGFGEGDLFTVQGSMLPFPATDVARQRSDDPRPSLEARYVSREVWTIKLAEATKRLVADRLLLAEDADRLIAAARETWGVYRTL